MVFKNSFVVAVKNNGKILRENVGEVVLPFGSEYSILMKNLDSRRAVVKVDIDGECVTDPRIIINGNTTFVLEGFKKGSEVKNKFRFIEKTEQISEYRGDRADDGIIRVEVWFEKPIPAIDWSVYNYQYEHPWKKYTIGENTWSYRSALPTDACNVETLAIMACCSMSTSKNDNGITVHGSDANQKFVSVSVNELDSNSTVFTLRLKGKTAENPKVEQPVTVETKLVCVTCGKTSKSNSKYCSRCGTRLRFIM
jgi:hypothetical protein